PPADRPAAEGPAAAKAYTSAASLLAGMPKDKYPRSGKNAVPERDAANDWLRDNVVGKVVEWTATVRDVTLSGQGNHRYLVSISFDKSGWMDWGGSIKLGEEDIVVGLTPGGYGQGLSQWSATTDEQVARQLRDLGGKTFTCRARITGAR